MLLRSWAIKLLALNISSECDTKFLISMNEKLMEIFSFNVLNRIGFPVMIGNVLLVTFYLLFAHVLFEWH